MLRDNAEYTIALSVQSLPIETLMGSREFIFPAKRYWLSIASGILFVHIEKDLATAN